MAKYELEKLEMRKAYSSTLDELINEDKRVFVLEADLAEAISTNSIAKTNKENYINCGIQYGWSSKWTFISWRYTFYSYI